MPFSREGKGMQDASAEALRKSAMKLDGIEAESADDAAG
jgi:hypothetical protein